MDEIIGYINKASEKLRAAKILYDSKSYSNSISMSYYAMFLVAKALLLKRDIEAKTHSRLSYIFYKTYVETGEFSDRVYRNFTRAQTLREQSDYSVLDDITQDIARKKLVHCKEFFNEAEKFL